MGEFDDKATQSEIQQLEGTMEGGQRNDTSFLKEILSKIPSGIFGDTDEGQKAEELQSNATAAQMAQTRLTPRKPEEFTLQLQEAVRQIYPIIEWHDDIMKSISNAIEKIPILPELIEQLEDQINIFVFSLIAPFVLPIIQQLKNELNTGSSEIIQSSKDKQLIVFYDDNSSDPTHSMLSKDHFSNILNEPAGKIASAVLKWAVPQIINAWDDESVDTRSLCDRIINGVFHHPAVRQYGDDGAADGRQQMFRVVEQWWSAKDNAEKRELRQKLSREGVQNGENHKEGAEDSGHGCCKPIGMAKTSKGEGAGGGMIGDLVSALGGGGMAAQAGSGYGRPSPNSEIGKLAEEAVGGGALGGLVGALAGGIGGGLLSDVFGSNETKAQSSKYDNQDGSTTQSYSEYGRKQDVYGQAQVSQTQYPAGGQRTEYSQYQQTASGAGSGYGGSSETQSYGGGDYETKTERWSENNEEERREREKKERKAREKAEKKKRYGGQRDDDDDDDEDEDSENDSEGSSNSYKRKKKEEKRRKKYEQQQQQQQQQETSYRGGGGGYQEPPRHEEQSYGGGGGYGGGYQEPPRREEQSYGGGGGYGGGYQEPPRREEESYGGGGGGEYGGGRPEGGYDGGGAQYGGGDGGERREEGGYGGQQGGGEYGGGGGGGYGREEGRDQYGGDGREGYGGGGGYRGE
jgi:hypothetical protein